MHTSGLIVTLADPLALRELSGAGPFILGAPTGPSVPAVLEVADPQAAQWWHDWTAALPGVEAVEVVFVHWDDSEDTDA
jgi:hypothetical protein